MCTLLNALFLWSCLLLDIKFKVRSKMFCMLHHVDCIKIATVLRFTVHSDQSSRIRRPSYVQLSRPYFHQWVNCITRVLGFSLKCLSVVLVAEIRDHLSEVLVAEMHDGLSVVLVGEICDRLSEVQTLKSSSEVLVFWLSLSLKYVIGCRKSSSLKYVRYAKVSW